MTNPDGMTTFQKFLSEQRAKKAAQVAEEKAKQDKWINPDGTVLGIEDYEDLKLPGGPHNNDTFKNYIRGLDASEAIRRLTTHPDNPTSFRKVESNMFHCPWPSHKDDEPSAWLNTDSKLWRCGPCEGGGDWLTLAGATYGLIQPGQKFKEGSQEFKNLLGQLKVDFGWVDDPTPTKDEALATVIRELEAREEVEVVEPAPVPEPEPMPEGLSRAEVAERSFLNGKYLVPGTNYYYSYKDDELTFPQFDIERVVPDSTSFLREYFTAHNQDALPTEFGLFLGLHVLSLAVGRRLMLADNRPVRANTAICLVADSGTGKTRSIEHATEMTRRVMDFSKDFPLTTSMSLRGVGSGEVLVHELLKGNPVMDFVTNKPVPDKYNPSTATVEFEELSALIAKTSNTSSTLKENLMKLFDGGDNVNARSLKHGIMVANYPFVNFISSTQTKRMADLFTTADLNSGFLNRILFVVGRPKYQRYGTSTAPDFTAAESKLQEIRAWAMMKSSDPTEPYLIAVSDDAKVEIEILLESRINTIKEQDEHSILGRLDLTMKRLALLFAINDKSDVLLPGHVHQAEALLMYLVNCYEILTDRLNITGTTDREEVVIKAIQRFMASDDPYALLGPTRRVIQQNIRFEGKKVKVGELNRVIVDLEKAGYIYSTPTSEGTGPESSRWRTAAEVVSLVDD